MAEFAVGKPCAEIRQTRKCRHFHAEGTRLDYFQYGGHPDCIRPQRLQHPHFGRRFVLRAEQPGIHAFVQVDVLGLRSATEFGPPLFGIRFR